MTSPNKSETDLTEKAAESSEKKSRFLPYQEDHSKKRLCNRESENSSIDKDAQENVNLPDGELKNLDIASEYLDLISQEKSSVTEESNTEDNKSDITNTVDKEKTDDEEDNGSEDEINDNEGSDDKSNQLRFSFFKPRRKIRFARNLRNRRVFGVDLSSEHSEGSDDSDAGDSGSLLSDSQTNVEDETENSETDDETDTELRTQRICKSLDKESIVIKNNLVNILFDRERGRKKLRTCVKDIISLKHNITRMSPYGFLEKHSGCVNALNFNETGTLIASGSDDMNIILWDWERLKTYVVYDSGHEANVFQCKFLPASNDSVIISAARDGQIRIADISLEGTCKGHRRLALHDGPAHRITLFQDSFHEFLTCGEDAVVYQIDCREPKAKKLLFVKEDGHLKPLYSIHANPVNSHEFCVGGKDPYIRVFDRRKIERNNKTPAPEPVKKFCPGLAPKKEKANVTCACYNYDGTEILGTYNDDDIYLFNNMNSDGDEYIHRYSGHRNNQTVKGVNFYGQKGEYILSGSDCGNIFFWDKESEAVVNYFHGDQGGVVNVLEPHPNLPLLATSGLDNDIKLWMPVSHEDNPLNDLETLMKHNWDDRKTDKRFMAHEDDQTMIWHLMRTLSHNRQTNDDSSREWNSTDDGNSDDGRQIQCAPQ